MRHVFPWGEEVHGRRFPRGAEYRKRWEVVQAARALSAAGVLRPDAEVLGVGAGNEPTLFWLTNHAKRVFRSEEHTAELQSLLRLSYAVFCLKQKLSNTHGTQHIAHTQRD